MKPKTQTIQFATVVKNGTVETIGKSYIVTPKPQCTQNTIKWFDDSKLIRR